MAIMCAAPRRCRPLRIAAAQWHEHGVEDGGVATAFEEVMSVREVLSGRKRPPANAVTIAGTDPVFSTRFKIAETCAAVLGGVGLAVSDIWELKTGRVVATLEGHTDRVWACAVTPDDGRDLGIR